MMPPPQKPHENAKKYIITAKRGRSVHFPDVQVPDQLLPTLVFSVMMQLEYLFVDWPDIGGAGERVQVSLQGRQLEVRSLVEGQDRNAVEGLETIGVGGVVNQHHLTQVTVDDAQVLDMHLVWQHPAVLTVQSVLEDLVVGVQLVQDGICILFLAGCEDDDLELAGHVLQEGQGVGANVDGKVVQSSLVACQPD